MLDTNIVIRLCLHIVFTSIAAVCCGANLYTGCLLFTIVNFLVGIIPTQLTRQRNLNLTLDRSMLAALFAYTIAVPTHHLFYRDYNEELVTFSMILCNVAICSFTLGVLGVSLFKHHPNTTTDSDTDSRSKQQLVNFKSGRLVIIAGVVTTFLSISLTVGVSAYLSAGYAGRALLKRETGPIELSLYHCVTGFVIVFCSMLLLGRLVPRKRYLIFTMMTVSFTAYVTFMLGIRRPTFFLAASLVTAYDSVNRTLNLPKLIAIGCIIVVVFGVFSNFRQVLSDTGVTVARDFVQTNADLEWLDLSRGEMGAPFRALMDVTAEWDSERPRLGSSFVAAVPNILPRQFGIHFPSLSEEYTRRHFTSDFIAVGGNMGFFAVAEGWVNGRSIGVIIHFFCLGCLLGYLDRRVANTTNLFIIAVHAIAAPWVVFYLRTDAGSILKVLLAALAYPLLQHLLFSRLYRENRGSSTLLTKNPTTL